MRQTNEPDDQQLNALYQTRKKRFTVPSRVRREVLEQAAPDTQWSQIGQRFTRIVAVASTFLLIMLVAGQQFSLTDKNLVEYTLVEVHSLQPQAPTDSARIRHRYRLHYDDFLSRKALFSAHHNKSATLYAAQDGWTLQTCDDAILNVSPGLIASLRELNKVDLRIRQGDHVNIQFAQNGIILGIEQNPQPLIC